MSGGHGNSLLLRIINKCLCFLAALYSLAYEARTFHPPSGLPVRAVNLGGWLVTEGWIKPSLFDGIPNKDLLDGTQLQFTSVAQNAVLSAERSGGAAVVAVPAATQQGNSSLPTFKLWRINETTFNFRLFDNQFVSVRGDAKVTATPVAPGPTETFQIVRNHGDKNRVRIRAPNGRFLQVKKDYSVMADYGESTSWGDSDPSVFTISTIFNKLLGEFQICNGYGTAKATPVLRKHWNTFIVEDDFKFMSSNGLNAVRIPVGWWIADRLHPPAPYVGGSHQTLDKAFKWAEY